MAVEIKSQADLRELLEGLGDNPNDIAGRLLDAGIQGQRDEAESCPIANWLRQETGGEPVVTQTYVELALDDGDLEITTPPAMRAFIQHFDFRQFPELDETP